MATRVQIYEVNVEGLTVAVKDQEALTKAIKDTKSELSKTDFGSAKYKEVDKRLNALNNIQTAVRKQSKEVARDLELAGIKGEGSFRELNLELNKALDLFKSLSRADQTSDIGKGLQQRIIGLRSEISEINALTKPQGKVGGFAGAFGSLGGIASSLASGPLAIAAIGAAAGAAAVELVDMSTEVKTLQGNLQTLSGDTGAALDQTTAKVLALEKTFSASREELIVSANAVSKAFDISFGEALDQIEEGFIAGSNLNGQFTDSLKEYPVFFAEAGLSAEQFFKVINEQSTQGIYSDKGVDVVKESLLRLRELPKATLDALDAIGLSGEQVRRAISEEGVGGAIALVAEQLDKFEEDAPQVGQALADIFGGPGEDVGIKFVKSLRTLNDETGSLIDNTNQLQVTQQETIKVNERFAQVQIEVANKIGGTGSTLSNLFTQIKTVGLQVVGFLIDRWNAFTSAMQPVTDAVKGLLVQLGILDGNGRATAEAIKFFQGVVQVGEKILVSFGKAIGFVIDAFTFLARKQRELTDFLGITSKRTKESAGATDDLATATEKLNKAQEQSKALLKAQADRKAAEEARKAADANKELEKSITKQADANKKAAVVADKFASDSIAGLRKEIAALQTQLESASPDQAQKILEKLIPAEKALKEAEEFGLQLRKRVTGAFEGFLDLKPITLPLTVDTEKIGEEFIKKKIELNEKEVKANYEKNQRILAQEQETNQRILEASELIFSSIQQANNLFAEAASIRNDNELADVERRFEREIELAEGNEERQAELEEQLAAERERIRRQEFEDQKRFRRASILASLAEGLVNILATPSTIPDPFGSIYKAAQAVFLVTTTGVQLANLSAQRAARGARITRGRIIGASHDDPSGGEMITPGLIAEHGERIDTDEFGVGYVINKRSSAVFGRQLDGMYGRRFVGKRQALSDINSYRQYGISFAAAGGEAFRPSVETLLGVEQTAVSPRTITIGEDSIQALAQETGFAVEVGSERGTSKGIEKATKQAEANQKVKSKTGL